VKIFNLADELQQGYHTYHISTLFSSSNPPIKPATPNGVVSGRTGIEYTYTTTATDPDNDQLYYLFDWGDGTYSEWLGPYVSGEECHATNTWAQQGTHEIKVKAKDTNGAESEWSNPLPVSMPYEHQTLWELIIEWILQLFGINTE
jgi:hypothetical protein